MHLMALIVDFSTSIKFVCLIIGFILFIYYLLQSMEYGKRIQQLNTQQIISNKTSSCILQTSQAHHKFVQLIGHLNVFP